MLCSCLIRCGWIFWVVVWILFVVDGINFFLIFIRLVLSCCMRSWLWFKREVFMCLWFLLWLRMFVFIVWWVFLLSKYVDIWVMIMINVIFVGFFLCISGFVVLGNRFVLLRLRGFLVLKCLGMELCVKLELIFSLMLKKIICY